MRRALLGLIQSVALAALPVVSGCVAVEPLVTPTSTATWTPSPTSTATWTPTTSPTPTSTPTPTPEPTATPRGHLEVAVILHGPSRFFQVNEVLGDNDASSIPILAYQGESIPDLTAFDAVILTGGEYSPRRFDEVPFLQQEKERVLQAIEAGVPVLGICLGHQLLVHWLGGRVERSAQFEVGWLEVALSEEGLRDPLLQGLEARYYAFLWHWDQVSELPPGGVNLASSELCPVQIFRYRDLPVWGIQSNPQYDAALAQSVLLGAGWLADLGVDAQAMAIKGHEVDDGSQGRIFGNFFQYVRTR
ncbi:MAG TPA: type 1 glutamine amidotransferase [Anaerolineae bacterium]|nr:type 1 glutamine amidotransferase [Anaerolineae bacterium]